MNQQISLETLKGKIQGELLIDNVSRILYATDASAYREKPFAVVVAANKNDILETIRFAASHHIPVIPRAAGTSLAGQVVGRGIVIDISKHFRNVIEMNVQEKWVKVEPGVVLDELNKIVAKHGLFFGPETSTSNRCMMAGMVGNNSCGAHSLIYGSTRDHTIEMECILSDGSEVVFGPLSRTEFEKKCTLQSLEGDIYRNISIILGSEENRREIELQYPDKEIKRRNTGYALDLLMETEIFSNSNEKFNFCKLLAGSEGTLAFTTAIKLNLVDLPPKQKALVCVHTKTLSEAFEANLIALKYEPGSVELMDKKVLDLTKENISQNRNRFFVEGDPEAILIVEWARDSMQEIEILAARMEADMREHGYGYAFPMITGSDIPRVWDLRKAGLGVLSNMPGDRKPVPVIEDTAVAPRLLPQYMHEFEEILKKLKLDCIYYAHIGTGELHLRPVLNLKDKNDVELFRSIALETALLVKKYKGSLSGEHGDGRLRGEFIPLVLGNKIYGLLKELKDVWDPKHIFNPNKIVDTPPMNSSLRYEPGMKLPEIETIFDFSSTGGMLRTAEKCNGAGDCRKTHIIGGTLCPSFQYTRDEKHSTRARANTIREIMTTSDEANPFASKEIYDVLDLCLVCKACKSECPSGVDVAKLKMEFLQHYYDVHGIPLRSRAIAYLPKIHKLVSPIPGIANFFLGNRFFSGIMKKIIKFAPQRNFPLMHRPSLKRWVKKYTGEIQTGSPIKTVYLFNDEFTNYLDANTGIAAIQLLNRLGYRVIIPKTAESARTWLSKGLVRTARKLANRNIELLKDLISEDTPLVGLEPSALLGFRDEFPDLAYPHNKEAALKMAKHCLLFEEFIVGEMEKGNISSEMFTDEAKTLKFHGHCQQKAVSTTIATRKALSLPVNYSVSEIPSGCCGMAGSFGYEKEHYDVSMGIGEMVLFPAIRNSEPGTIVVASGTSCRCQIDDGTGVKALHPAEVLWMALKK
ncbi:MAG TPA: FAD-linked oxidase C-terminal domain-containing protein [Bacteroidales bacterium]|nr:FAD-linked oxidase C-terminal domain-containing protein [Bacteroidales bacterium]